jgi:signal transduction histidine kinase/ligand-binding sensor domain-containing protein
VFPRGLRISCLVAALAGASTAPVAHALDPRTPITQFGHDVWQQGDGLPQNSVEAIAQTLDGYLWFGTEEGLVRFDGLRFVVFSRNGPEGLRHDSVKALMAARDGSLWVGTNGGGVARHVAGRFTMYTRADGLAGNTVSVIAQDQDGDIWIGTNDGLSRFDGARFTTYGESAGLPPRPVRAIRVDRQGTLWVATGRGAYRQRAGRFEPVPGIGPKLRAIAESRDGSLWFATSDRGVARLTAGTVRWLTTRDGLLSNNVQALIEDRHGGLWLGTEGAGIARVLGGAVSAMGSRQGLSSDFLRAVFEDREGSLWFGTEGGGLNRLRHSRISMLDANDGLGSDFARAVYQDHAGAMWVASDGGGLTRFGGGAPVNFTRAHGLPAAFVYALLDDPQGRLWLGTNGAGVAVFDPRRRRAASVSNLPSDGVFSLARAPDGRVWAGTSLGLAAIDGLRAHRVPEVAGEPAVAQGHVAALHVARDGTLWIGMRDRGLWSLAGGRLVRHGTHEGLADASVSAIHEDARGVLWVTTRQGLVRRDPTGALHRFSRADGLHSDTLYSVVEDDREHLWLTSTTGIFRVHKPALDRRRAGEGLVTSEVFGVDEGMRVSEATGGGHPAAQCAPDGTLWFPTPRGVVMIDADQPASIAAGPPPIVIEEFAADDRLLPLADRAPALEASVDTVRIRYTALTFLAPAKVRFRYRLEGHDPTWLDAGPRREVSYRRLPAGTYTFRVVGMTGAGVRNDTGASVTFTIVPPFYRTAWFAALCVGVLCLTGLVVHRSHVRAMRRQFAAVLAERARLARELHDTLLQGFAGTALQLDAVRQQVAARDAASPAVDKLDRVLTQVDTCLTEARRSIGDMRALALEHGELVLAVKRMAGQLAQETGLAIDMEVTGRARRLDPAVENDLLRVGQEALTNAVRYAGASLIRVDLRYERRKVRLLVQDDGRGFDEPALMSDASRKFGVRGMRERIERLGGQFTLRSQPGAGTVIDVSVPLRG